MSNEDSDIYECQNMIVEMIEKNIIERCPTTRKYKFKEKSENPFMFVEPSRDKHLMVRVAANFYRYMYTRAPDDIKTFFETIYDPITMSVSDIAKLVQKWITVVKTEVIQKPKKQKRSRRRFRRQDGSSSDDEPEQIFKVNHIEKSQIDKNEMDYAKINQILDIYTDILFTEQQSIDNLLATWTFNQRMIDYKQHIDIITQWTKYTINDILHNTDKSMWVNTEKSNEFDDDQDKDLTVEKKPDIIDHKDLSVISEIERLPYISNDVSEWNDDMLERFQTQFAKIEIKYIILCQQVPDVIKKLISDTIATSFTDKTVTFDDIYVALIFEYGYQAVEIINNVDFVIACLENYKFPHVSQLIRKVLGKI